MTSAIIQLMVSFIIATITFSFMESPCAYYLMGGLSMLIVTMIGDYEREYNRGKK